MKWVSVIATLLATPLGAHPHIFVDAGLELIVDEQGRLAQVRVTWAYDALYSLLITEDYGLDADGDAVLSSAEEAQLAGFDMQWVPGFNGDLVGSLGDKPLVLGGPKDVTAVMREGRIVTTHLRDVAGLPAVAGEIITFAPFDPSYYTAYDVTQRVSVTGMDGCMIAKDSPDLDVEMEKLQAELATLGQDQDAVEMGFPEVGAAFATKVRISCAGF
ncbi:MAG: DUF1007 family protein [Sulfitobacter sp.]